MSTNNITTELVKELRDATGISVMQCRKALVEAEGDMQKALAILKKTSAEIALKKADREVKDGRVVVKNTGSKTIMIALNCETDFVARNDDFVNLSESLADKALKEGVEAMKSSAKEMIDPIIQKTGENITLGEAVEIDAPIVGSYVHNNKSAVIVTLDGGNADVAKDVAMHIAAMKPEYIKKDDIDEAARNMMTEVFMKEVANVDKPEDIKKKMLEGKIATYFKEKTLLDQPFIKDGEMTVGQLLEKNKASIKEVKKCSI